MYHCIVAIIYFALTFLSQFTLDGNCHTKLYKSNSNENKLQRYLKIKNSFHLFESLEKKMTVLGRMKCVDRVWQISFGSGFKCNFLTAAAQNLLYIKLAEELGVIVLNPWVTWLKAASLPAFVCLLLMPLILYKLYPPEIKDKPEAPALAAKKLESMGHVTRNEWIMVGKHRPCDDWKAIIQAFKSGIPTTMTHNPSYGRVV